MAPKRLKRKESGGGDSGSIGGDVSSVVDRSRVPLAKRLRAGADILGDAFFEERPRPVPQPLAQLLPHGDFAHGIRSSATPPPSIRRSARLANVSSAASAAASLSVTPPARRSTISGVVQKVSVDAQASRQRNSSSAASEGPKRKTGASRKQPARKTPPTKKQKGRAPSRVSQPRQSAPIAPAKSEIAQRGPVARRRDPPLSPPRKDAQVARKSGPAEPSRGRGNLRGRGRGTAKGQQNDASPRRDILRDAVVSPLESKPRVQKSGARVTSRGRGRGGGAGRGKTNAGGPVSEDVARHAAIVENSSPQLRTIVTAQEIEMDLQQESSTLGRGTRAMVLFAEEYFDSAIVVLEPGAADLQECNSCGTSMLYVVLEGEAEKVQLELPDLGELSCFSVGTDISIPAGASYAVRNLSRRVNAKLLAVVPRKVGAN